MAALATVTLLGAAPALADDEAALFRDLIPGETVGDEALAEVHGKGFVIEVSFETMSESSFDRRPNLRAVLMGGMRSAGIQPPLAPSGPNGAAGGGAFPIPKLPSFRIAVPSVPSAPTGSFGSSSGSGSFSLR